ncbi:MAG: hypothetical protein OEN20_00790 [Gammaproteobacteria bacterium]|nr:hypothetical protein [Gammaproteobacteria bacterium]
MAAVLNRTTRQYIQFANTPDYPTVDWIINPDLSAVVGFDSKYWIITGDIVTLMDQASRDAVDAQEFADAAAASTAEAVAPIAATNDPIGARIRGLVELLNKRDNYLVNRIEELQNALLAAKAATGGAQNTRDALPATYLPTNTRTRAAAISDLRSFIDTLPGGE